MLETQDTGRVRLLTLNRPEALNAFNQQLYLELANALDAAGSEDGVSVVVLTWRGRAFSAGNDLVEMSAQVSGERLPSDSPR